MKKNYLIYLVFVGSLIISIFFVQKALAACPSVYGNYTLTGSCNVPDNSYMVIINGNLTINSGVTLTLGNNAKLIFTPGYSVYLGGTIALTSTSGMTKKTATTVDNLATGNTCATVCSNAGKVCAGIGQDSYGTDTYYWGATSGSCTSGACTYSVGDCSTAINRECSGTDPQGNTLTTTCCGNNSKWTRCLCIDP